MTIITQNTTFTIPSNLQDNAFILSILEQSLTKELSKKQLQTLMDILDMSEPEPQYSTQITKRYIQNFYRTDYHGDYLKDTTYAYDILEENLEDKIQDAHAAQYRQEAYIRKYAFNKDISIPANVTNISYFMTMFYDDYKFLSEKITRNKFRKIKAKNLAYRALESLVQGDVNLVDEGLVNKAVGKQYRRWA